MAGYPILTEATLVAESGTAFLTEATMSAGVRDSAILTRARIVDPSTALTVEAGVPITEDPFDLITLAANVTGTPDTVVWTLDSATNGAVPLLIGSGASVTYYAPPTVNGTVLTWRVTVTKTGSQSVTDTVVHTIRNHAGPWFITGSDYLNSSGRTGVKIGALQSAEELDVGDFGAGAYGVGTYGP